MRDFALAFRSSMRVMLGVRSLAYLVADVLPLQLILRQLIVQEPERRVVPHLADVVHAGVELEALLVEGVAAAADLVVLLEHEDALAGLGEDAGGRHGAWGEG